MSTALTRFYTPAASFVVIALFMLIGAVATAVPAHASPNSCSTFQASKASSGTITVLNGVTSPTQSDCASECTAYASQISANVSCQLASVYYPAYVCFPDGYGGTICGDMGGQTVNTCSAGNGAVVSGTNSAATCAYVPTPLVSVAANPSTVQNGASTIISWNATNALSCDATSVGGSASELASGSKTVTVNAGSASSKTYSITCMNAAGATASASVTVTVANPNTPASCSAWSGTTWPSGGGATLSSYSGSDATQANAVAVNCPATCAAASSNDAKTYTCGYEMNTITQGIGGHNYNGVEGYSTYYVSCFAGVGSGTTSLPPSTYSSSVTVDGTTYTGSQVTSDVANSCNNTYGTCTTYEQQTSYAGSTTCVSTPTGSPDLTASSITPTTVTAAQSTTFSATIANIGTATTDAGFTDTFQLSNSSTGTGAVNIGTYSNPTLAANASNAAAVPYTFSTAGTYYVRACADSANVITESNDNNNCGAWTPITVTAGTASCTAWNSSLYPSGSNGTTGPGSTAADCTSYCANVAQTNGGSYTCGLWSYSYQVGGQELNGGLGYATQNYTVSGCYVTSGTGTVSSGGSDTNTCNVDTIGSYCSISQESYAGATTCTYNATPLPPPTLTGSCSVSPTSIGAGQSAVWTASASGGTGIYTYAWSAPGGSPSTGSNNTLDATYATAGTMSASVTITSGTQSKTIGCDNSLTVNAAAAPNLTAGSITPTSATAGTPVSLHSTISNIGTGNTNTGFTDLFQRATDSSGSNATDIGTYANAALAASAANTASLSYNFPSAGTWYVRACADKSSMGDVNGTIVESNDNDNCGPWTDVVVSPPIPPPSATCSLTPQSGIVPTTLTWSSANATSCTLNGASVALNGSETASVAGPYHLACTGAGAPCTADASFSNGTCAGPAAVDIKANGFEDSTRVRKNDPVTITWTASDVPGASSSCTITGPDVGGAGIDSKVVSAGAAPTCSIPNGSASPTITAQSVYTITCGGVKDSVIVNLIPQLQEF